MTRELAVQSVGSGAVGAVGFLRGVKCTKKASNAVRLDKGGPPMMIALDAFEAMSIENACLRVARVLRTGGLAKIGPSVVVSISVPVVNFVLRPLARDDKPDQAMRLNLVIIERHYSVATLLADKARNFSHNLRVWASQLIETRLSGKTPCFWVVEESPSRVVNAKSFANDGGACNFLGSHWSPFRFLVRSRTSRYQRGFGFAIMSQATVGA